MTYFLTSWQITRLLYRSELHQSLFCVFYWLRAYTIWVIFSSGFSCWGHSASFSLQRFLYRSHSLQTPASNQCMIWIPRGMCVWAPVWIPRLDIHMWPRSVGSHNDTHLELTSNNLYWIKLYYNYGINQIYHHDC